MSKLVFLPFAAAVTLLSQSAIAAGHSASTQATATVWDQPTASFVQPWAAFAPNGNEGGVGAPAVKFATSENGGSLHGKNLSSFAEADLENGTLRVSTHVENTSSTPTIYGTSYASARFRDGFSFASSGGGAFTWNPDSTVTFKIRLDGNSQNTTSNTQIDWGVDLSIYTPGTFAGPTSAYDSRALGGASWISNITSTGSRVFTDVATDARVVPTLSLTGTTLADGYELAATFNPGGDFDWSLELYSLNRLSDQIGISSADLSHTATVSFIGPLGAAVTSESGVFPLTSPVPEPETYAMLLAGLGVLGFIGKRRRAG